MRRRLGSEEGELGCARGKGSDFGVSWEVEEEAVALKGGVVRGEDGALRGFVGEL